MSYQDTTFYALLGLMASAGLTQNDVNVQQVGPTGVWQFVADRQVGRHGRRAGLDPAGAGRRREGQRASRPTSSSRTWRRAIAASDDIIKQKPEMIRKFVSAALQRHEGHDGQPGPGRRRVREVRAGMAGQGRPRSSSRSTTTPSLSIRDRSSSARSIVDRLAKLQDFYLAKGFIQKKTPVDGALQQRVHEVATTGPIARPFSAARPRESGDPVFTTLHSAVVTGSRLFASLGRDDRRRPKRHA